MDGVLPTGIDRVGIEYVRHYGTRQSARAVLSEKGFCSVLSREDSERAFDLVLRQPRNARTQVYRLIAKALVRSLVPRGVRRGVLLHTSHSGLEHQRYFGALDDRDIKVVGMVHDLIPLTHPQHCRPGTEGLHRKRIHHALRRSAGLIANSQATLESLAIEASKMGMGLPPAVVAHLAMGVADDTVMAPVLSKPYFVMVGTIESRKNHWMILNVWRRLIESQGSQCPMLVIVGRRGWESENAIDMLDRCSELRDFVIEESRCSDDRLRAYLQHAQALLFPSFAEGYGMPLAEALAMNVPVIASDLTVFREIAADIPDYLDPLDGPGWISQVLDYATPYSQKRQSQLKRMEHFSAPTWSQHFKVVDELIETLG